MNTTPRHGTAADAGPTPSSSQERTSDPPVDTSPDTSPESACNDEDLLARYVTSSQSDYTVPDASNRINTTPNTDCDTAINDDTAARLRGATLYLQLNSILDHIDSALAECNSIRYHCAKTYDKDDPVGPPPPIPQQVQKYLIPSAADLDALEHQLRRRAYGDIYYTTKHVDEALRPALEASRARLRGARRPSAYDVAQLTPKTAEALNRDSEMHGAELAALRRAVWTALTRDARVVADLQWADWIRGRGRRLTHDQHRTQVANAYQRYWDWVHDGYPHGPGLKHITTVCRELQGRLMRVELDWVVGVVRQLGWAVLGADVIWEPQRVVWERAEHPPGAGDPAPRVRESSVLEGGEGHDASAGPSTQVHNGVAST